MLRKIVENVNLRLPMFVSLERDFPIQPGFDSR